MKHVFRIGQCVKSHVYGFGQALTVGEAPLIRFLDGRETEINASELIGVPDERFEAEIVNRTAVEKWSLVRAHGSAWLDPDNTWMLDDEGIWMPKSAKARRDAEPPSGVEQYFVPDEIGELAYVVNSAS